MEKKYKMTQLEDIALDMWSDKPFPETTSKSSLADRKTFPLGQPMAEEPVRS